MDEYNCFFFVKTELLFDIEIGSVVFKVYGISDFQNYMVRYSGIVKRYGLTTMQMMMLDSDDSESDKEDDEYSAGMDGFFYERAFEAVEQLMDAATVWCCRDSAIFSYRDQRQGQEIGSMTESTTVTIKPPPPPTAAKTQRTQYLQNTHTLAILERTRSRDDNGKCSNKEVSASASLENLKSIAQRRIKQSQAISSTVKTDDESETRFQHSMSTVNTVVKFHLAGLSDDSLDSHSPIQRKTSLVMIRSQTRFFLSSKNMFVQFFVYYYLNKSSSLCQK